MSLLESNLMKKGSEIIPFSLPDIDNQTVSSLDYNSVNALLVIFTCNHCPYAIASWPILVQLQKKYSADGYQTIAINPNNNPGYPQDAHDKMKPFAEKIGINFPYLFDTEQKIAKQYKAVCTPDPFLFQKGKLFYHGRINDNWENPSMVKEQSLEMHIQAALGKKANSPDKTYPSMGCSIKWM